jgi:hypothetical protein
MEQCYRCHNNFKPWGSDKRELQTRFSNGTKEYLCESCADGANNALKKSRDTYGINKKVWTYIIKKFKKDNNISLMAYESYLIPGELELLTAKKRVLLRLMFIMDIRAVRKYIQMEWDRQDKFKQKKSKWKLGKIQWKLNKSKA